MSLLPVIPVAWASRPRFFLRFELFLIAFHFFPIAGAPEGLRQERRAA